MSIDPWLDRLTKMQGKIRMDILRNVDKILKEALESYDKSKGTPPTLPGDPSHLDVVRACIERQAEELDVLQRKDSRQEYG